MAKWPSPPLRHFATSPLRHSQGQALVEFAILGSLALLALAFMIQISLRMNYQQEIQQQTFRQALRVAKSEGDEESQAIQVQHFRDRQIPNPSQGFAVMSRTPTQASAAVTWGERLTYLSDDRDSQPRIVVRLNQAETELRSEDLPKDQPLVRRIDKRLTSTGAVTQRKPDEGLPETSRLQSTTTDTSSMTLSTGATLSSSMSSTCRFEGDIWTCSR